MILLTTLICESADITNKIRVGNSTLYGVVHGERVQIKEKDYKALEAELSAVNGTTFYEGPVGHESITKKLLNKFPTIKIKSTSWEPEESSLTGNAKVGSAVAGWWNQTLDDAVGLDNIKSAWEKTGLPTTSLIGDVFKTSVGQEVFDYIINNFTDYSNEGRYSKEDFINALSQQAFDENGNPTEALETFNLAGHDQVFPEDNDLTPGKLKSSEQAFNLFRDRYLLNMMKKIPGIYFAGEGHITNIKNIIKKEI
jgi:hypothetical protein